MTRLWHSLSKLAVLTVVAHATCGFVLLSSHEAHLQVDPSSPTMTFTWDGKAPTDITGKDKYKDGLHQGLDNVAMMKQLLDDAMGLWNDVPGSYVKLAVQTGVAEDSPTDRHNSILVLHDANLSSAALAKPQFDPANPNIISDCDVHINNSAVVAGDLAFIIAHELGHCLGLGHAHTNYGAIMGYSRADHSLSLGLDDKGGVIYLYPDPAVWDGKTKELVCGAIGAETGATQAATATGALSVLALLCLPALLPALAAVRRRSRS